MAGEGEVGRCQVCHHSWRVGARALDYEGRATGAPYDEQRLDDQIAFFNEAIFRGMRVFEVGCADGKLAAALKERLRWSRYEGVEPSQARRLAEPHLDRVYRRWPGGKAGRSSADLIIMSHVLEHIRRVHDMVARIVRRLAPGGRVFVEVPLQSGHPALPFDQNPGHLHFFSALSLSTLLARGGLVVRKIQSGCMETPRYPDCVRVLAARHLETCWRGDELSSQLPRDLQGAVVVWGAGGVAKELMVPFFDAERITCWVDQDPKKQGHLLHGKPIYPPSVLAGLASSTVLISSLDHAEEIRKRIQSEFSESVSRIITMAELLKA